MAANGDTERAKPRPDLYLEALDRLGLKPRRRDRLRGLAERRHGREGRGAHLRRGAEPDHGDACARRRRPRARIARRRPVGRAARTLLTLVAEIPLIGAGGEPVDFVRTIVSHGVRGASSESAGLRSPRTRDDACRSATERVRCASPAPAGNCASTLSQEARRTHEHRARKDRRAHVPARRGPLGFLLGCARGRGARVVRPRRGPDAARTDGIRGCRENDLHHEHVVVGNAEDDSARSWITSAWRHRAAVERSRHQKRWPRWTRSFYREVVRCRLSRPVLQTARDRRGGRDDRPRGTATTRTCRTTKRRHDCSRFPESGRMPPRT